MTRNNILQNMPKNAIPSKNNRPAPPPFYFIFIRCPLVGWLGGGGAKKAMCMCAMFNVQCTSGRQGAPKKKNPDVPTYLFFIEIFGGFQV
jgi:hypothetical protein